MPPTKRSNSPATRRRHSLHRLVRPFPLYHWSPVERRPQILKRGLRPHVASRCGQWKAPYVCFSDSPSLAWVLSADTSDVPGEWDLWMTWSNVTSKMTRRNDLENGRGRPTEFRVFGPIPKSRLWHVGTRSHLRDDRLNEARLKWLHDCSGCQTDPEGYEWGIYRVKWKDGNAVDVQQTLSDMSDLDAEMERERSNVSDQRPGPL